MPKRLTAVLISIFLSLGLQLPIDKGSDSQAATNSKYVDTAAINVPINPAYKVGKYCGGDYGWQMLGLDKNNKPAFIKCSDPAGGKFVLDQRMFKIDPKTKKPLVPVAVPSKTYFARSPHVYVIPNVSSASPILKPNFESDGNVLPCKISETNDYSRGSSLGFPLPETRPRLKQDFRIAVLPVQFTDHKTKNDPNKDIADVVTELSNFYERMSAVPISFDWDIPTSYKQLGVTIDSFKLDVQLGGGGDFWKPYGKYVQRVIDVYDAQFDYSEYDVVIIEEPRTVRDKEHQVFVPQTLDAGSGPKFTSADGILPSVIITGNDESRDISNWIHEFGHELGLSDRNWSTDSTPAFDIMFGWYGNPELSAWNRWLLGILEDQQVDCKTDQATSTHLVRPIAWPGVYKKAIVIPVSKHSALVVESRRRLGYDSLLGKESEGAYVYRIDASVPIYQQTKVAPVDVVKPSRSQPMMSWSLDAALDPGESVTSDGWSIKVLEAGVYGDLVEVSRVK